MPQSEAFFFGHPVGVYDAKPKKFSRRFFRHGRLDHFFKKLRANGCVSGIRAVACFQEICRIWSGNLRQSMAPKNSFFSASRKSRASRRLFRFLQFAAALL